MWGDNLTWTQNIHYYSTEPTTKTIEVLIAAFSI